MTSLNVQPSEFTTRYVDPEGTPIPNAGQALLGGSSNAPKFGTLIPNRIFVGGIPSNTTEQELKTYFSGFGQVKDVKIINDRLGVSKGSYGFVTFENQEVAENIIKNESETLIFKDRKLNIGHAIRKQQLFPRPADVPTALFFTGGAIPCGFQGGMPMFPMSGSDYSLLAQPGSPYQQMLLQQANGTVYLSPQASQAAQYSALQSQLAQPNALATLQQHQQPYQQVSLANPLTASSLAPGSQNTQAAVMAAAAAAVAAASQWPNSAVSSNQQSGHQLPLSNGHPQNSSQVSPGLSGLDSQPQVAALAAAVAAQQQLAAWRWPTQQNGNPTNQTAHTVLASSPIVSTSTSVQGTGCSISTNGQQQPQQQQSPIPATLGPSTYVYNPMAGAGHELLFIHQTNPSYTPNATSDYSTDHSAHSSSYLESVEQSSFHCDVSPPSRHSHTCGSTQSFHNPYDFACVSPYNTVPTIFNAVATSSPAMRHSMLQQHLRQQPGSGMLSVSTGQPLITLANPQLTQAQQHKLFASLPQNVGPAGQNCQLGTQTLYGTPQPIILDVYSGGVPIPQLRPEGLMTNSAESLDGVRGTSPKKLTPVTASMNGVSRGMMENLNSANNTTTHSM